MSPVGPFGRGEYRSIPAGYLLRLEALVEVVGQNEEGMLDCWNPGPEAPATTGDGWVDLPCEDCPPCRLRQALDALQAWEAEHALADA